MNQNRSTLLKIAAGAMAVGTVISLVDSDWIGVGLKAPLAAAFALMASGRPDEFRWAKQVTYLLLGIGCVFIAVDIFL
jgi:hypothetical protein